jgi:hypothetical protein
MDIFIRIVELIRYLEWALDLIDLYDKRLAAIDGPEAVYTETHVRQKQMLRNLIDEYTQAK